MTQYTRSSCYDAGMRRNALIVLACIVGVGVNCFLVFPALPQVIGGDNDFMGFYAASHLSGSDLYDHKAIVAIEKEVWNTPRNLPFARFPFYAVMVSPLRYFSYQHAYWVWQFVSALSIVLFCVFWPSPKKWAAAVACCWSLPLLQCFIMGQDVTFILLVFGISIALFSGGWRFAAGCVFSLCCIKYNLFMALPLLILARRLWRFGTGLAVGGAALLAVSFAVGGRYWPWQYAAMLPSTASKYAGMPNLHGMFAFLPSSLLAESVGTGIVILIAWFVIRGGNLKRSISATLIASLFISYHAYLQDAMILIPAALLLLFDEVSSVPLKTAAIFLLCPLSYLPFISITPFPYAIMLLLPLLVMLVEEFMKRVRTGESQPGSAW
jgi:hypothetical protein